MSAVREMVLKLAAVTVLGGLAAGGLYAEEVDGAADSTEVAIFAGGCFWCMEPPYDKLDGVLSTVSGYIGGSAEDATYQQVSSGSTDHYEAVKIEFDPSKVDYAKLLEVFWRNIDPFDGKGQFCDKGPQYRAAIFALTERQRELADASKAKLADEKDGEGPFQTEVLPAKTFFPAEDYHQDYYMKNALRYKFYRWGCGRDQRLERIWGPS